MNQLAIDGGGYDSAAEALVGGNQLAALYFHSLTGDLGGYGGMAGDDTTSEEFAAEYDASAQLCVDAIGELVDAYANLAELTAQSIANHRNANGNSVYGAQEYYDGDGSLGDEPVAVGHYAVPRALGGNPSDTPDFWDEILSHLEGFAWPNADDGRLRTAAATWRRAAEDVGRLSTYNDTAIRMLERSTSPEIPLAVNAVRDLGTLTDDVADALLALGEACDDYADQVVEHRETIKGIVEDMAIEAGISIVAGAVVGFFSFGAGAAGGAAIAGWRIASAARKILTALRTLKNLHKARAVAKLERAGAKLKELRDKLRKLIDAKKLKRKQKKRGKPGDPLKPKDRPDAAGDDWEGRVANDGKGEVWQRPGATKNSDMLRIKDPDANNPHGSVRFYNDKNQPIGLDGKPGNNAHTHIPIRPDGTFPTPKGWNK